jgi:hypothetical protein
MNMNKPAEFYHELIRTIKSIAMIKKVSTTILTRKKEVIQARSEKLDPNTKDPSQKIHLKKKGKRLVIDDGFEHRTSKETTDPILPTN